MHEPISEAAWMKQLRAAADPRRILRRFCQHYYYFSTRQVQAFAGLFRLVSPVDSASLAILGDVLHEELGRGHQERVHSVLFHRFATATGLASADVAIEESAVAPGVKAYVAELFERFGNGPLEEALASYLFLECSAVLTYGPLLDLLRGFGFSDDELEFFKLHSVVEIEHERSAREMTARLGGSSSAQIRIEAQLSRMSTLWAAFWDDIFQLARTGAG
jgi:pyrroloquinoline quinone (PQQ) biosynthesis protein C